MNAIYRIGVCLTAGVLSVACDLRGESDADVKVCVGRLDAAAAQYRSLSGEAKDSVRELFAPALPLLASMFGADSAGSAMDVYAGSAAVGVFAPDVAAAMPDLSWLEEMLGSARGVLAREVPAVNFPAHIYGMVTPYNQSIVVADSVMFIGLNHYLGAGYAGYAGFDDYRRRQKVPGRMPVDVLEAVVALSCPYVQTGVGGDTVLSRMLYDGAVVASVHDALPDVELADVLGWSADEMAWAEKNECKVWETIVGRELLYSTDPMDAERLVSPSPATSIVHADAPGRIGRYIGYKIVKKYLDGHPDATVPYMLSPGFYGSRTALIESGYSGK